MTLTINVFKQFLRRIKSIDDDDDDDVFFFTVRIRLHLGPKVKLSMSLK